jgi:low temperature requirement protein LtrA
VAAVAALAQELHDDVTVKGILVFCALFVPIWWAWMGFTWYATAFDNDDVIFRLAYLGVMLLVIIVAASIEDVKGDATEAFVIAYASMTAVLAALWLRARYHATGGPRRFTTRYAVGNAVGSLIWFGSVAFEPPTQHWIWVAAMLVLLTTPVVAVRSMAEQSFDSIHIPERYGLFTLIVLGESIVVVAAGIAEFNLETDVLLTAAVGFGIAACAWWVYFDYMDASALSRNTLLPAFVWGYGHLLIFAGIAAASVGVQLGVEAAVQEDAMRAEERAILAGGLAAYLFAIGAIRWVTVKRVDATVAARFLVAALAVAVGFAGRGVHPGLVLLVLFLGTLGHTLYEAGRDMRAKLRAT